MNASAQSASEWNRLNTKLDREVSTVLENFSFYKDRFQELSSMQETLSKSRNESNRQLKDLEVSVSYLRGDRERNNEEMKRKIAKVESSLNQTNAQISQLDAMKDHLSQQMDSIRLNISGVNNSLYSRIEDLRGRTSTELSVLDDHMKRQRQEALLRFESLSATFQNLRDEVSQIDRSMKPRDMTHTFGESPIARRSMSPPPMSAIPSPSFLVPSPSVPFLSNKKSTPMIPEQYPVTPQALFREAPKASPTQTASPPKASPAPPPAAAAQAASPPKSMEPEDIPLYGRGWELLKQDVESIAKSLFPDFKGRLFTQTGFSSDLYRKLGINKGDFELALVNHDSSLSKYIGMKKQDALNQYVFDRLRESHNRDLRHQSRMEEFVKVTHGNRTPKKEQTPKKSTPIAHRTRHGGEKK
jgi:hypothetical protein